MIVLSSTHKKGPMFNVETYKMRTHVNSSPPSSKSRICMRAGSSLCSSSTVSSVTERVYKNKNTTLKPYKIIQHLLDSYWNNNLTSTSYRTSLAYFKFLQKQATLLNQHCLSQVPIEPAMLSSSPYWTSIAYLKFLLNQQCFPQVPIEPAMLTSSSYWTSNAYLKFLWNQWCLPQVPIEPALLSSSSFWTRNAFLKFLLNQQCFPQVSIEPAMLSSSSYWTSNAFL